MANNIIDLYQQISDLDAKIDQLQRNIRDNEFLIHQAQTERLEAQKALIRLRKYFAP